MMTLNEKKVELIIVEQSVVKDVKIYFIGLKKTCLGVLDRGDQSDDNKRSLKEGGVIEMSTTVLSIYAMLSLFRFEFSPGFVNKRKGESVVSTTPWLERFVEMPTNERASV